MGLLRLLLERWRLLWRERIAVERENRELRDRLRQIYAHACSARHVSRNHVKKKARL